MGEQGDDDGVAEQVDGGLVPGGDHEYQRVDEFLLGEAGVALVVPRRDEIAGHVVARRVPPGRDQVGQQGVRVALDGQHLLRVRRGAGDVGDETAEVLARSPGARTAR
ncbi:hypothetical protein [Microtetraspora malaysiensis]|uniref:hypothetical protein n=1 Tax=Microtetraspora malaysiensis TaxID=161358 RepID=UPI003D94BDB0